MKIRSAEGRAAMGIRVVTGLTEMISEFTLEGVQGDLAMQIAGRRVLQKEKHVQKPCGRTRLV